MAIIELNNITKKYGNKKVLDNFSLNIDKEEMVAIMGASGQGKTTILNIIGLLEKFDDGTLTIDDECNVKINSIRATKILREKISYLFQNFALVEDESVFYNLNLALKYVKGTKSYKKELVKNALKTVGLENYEKNKIFELSGGEQQRVSIARSILKPCKIILADEPTGSLDEENSYKIIGLLKLLNKKGKTIVIVTHDKNIANECNRIINI
ncbi:macrolide export ATP-binding/permease protein MacB [Clostridium botulinum A3 str. Loch Maree]|uniref:putative bacteriocin export ABC transporter n=1 Tax=Clostridium botulinum TaxID=1491 RepID=UPI000170FC83|nr:putative bacteriocin export ABC transporter [Clostridium botulinum]ACA53696.1 macrolide export ATP-binding/permease protein MacB [Clostridium botulinum A3 str. Loch Maree]